MKTIFLLLLSFFLTSCATKKIDSMQKDTCVQLKKFPDFHRCSEAVVKNSYAYKLSLDRDIIDVYFAYGELLALDVEKGRKNNFEAYNIWGKELEKSIEEAELKGKKTAKTVIVTAAIAVAVYIIYKEYLEDQLEIKEVTEAKKTTTNSFNAVSYRNSQACNYGKYIYSVTGRLSGYLNKC